MKNETYEVKTIVWIVIGRDNNNFLYSSSFNLALHHTQLDLVNARRSMKPLCYWLSRQSRILMLLFRKERKVLNRISYLPLQYQEIGWLNKLCLRWCRSHKIIIHIEKWYIKILKILFRKKRRILISTA